MKPCAALLILPRRSPCRRLCLRRPGATGPPSKVDGLAENACVSVTIGAGGTLVQHLKSTTVSALDGYEVTSIPAPGPNRFRVYEGPGVQLWTVAPEGLREFRDGEWVLHRVPEIAEHFRAGFTIQFLFAPCVRVACCCSSRTACWSSTRMNPTIRKPFCCAALIRLRGHSRR
jgi:hypothetical protein